MKQYLINKYVYLKLFTDTRYEYINIYGYRYLVPAGNRPTPYLCKRVSAFNVAGCTDIFEIIKNTHTFPEGEGGGAPPH